MPHAYLSHIAVDNADPGLFLALAVRALNAARERRYAHVTFSLSERHPCLTPFRERIWSIVYSASLYVCHWEDGLNAAAQLDSRPAHLEAAVL